MIKMNELRALIQKRKEQHVRLWEWLVDNPTKTRKEHLKSRYDCYACLFLNDVQETNCGSCLLEWPDQRGCVYSSVFTSWRDASDPEVRATLAYEIAHLPLNPIWQIVLDEPIEEYALEPCRDYFGGPVQELNFDGGYYEEY